MSDDKLYTNGINGSTGEYLLPPLEVADVAKVAAGEKLDAASLGDLKYRARAEEHFGIKEGLDPKDLSEAGWAVVFPHASKGTEAAAQQEAIRSALAPLLALRRSQAGDRFKELTLRPRESKQKFLARYGAGPGPADPDNVPYYLMLVGDPSQISFRVQTQLDVQYAVGRIHFDAVEDYAQYAASVVAAETGGLKRARRAAFWGVDCPGDRATNLSAKSMIAPLSAWSKADQGAYGWSIDTFLKEEATKANLARLLGGEDTPALLYTASHGMGFDKDDPQQRARQGALLCQDWPGPAAWGRKPITPDLFFSAEDLADAGSLLGLVSFFFACYGAGTPQHDEFSKQAFKKRGEIAPSPFVADLPRQMLCHPKGGALAVIGHIERAWGYSFVWQGTGRANDGDSKQLAVFESTLKRLMEGHPVGSALEYFNQRYAELASDLADQVELREFEEEGAVDDFGLAAMWTANNDARGYAIVGDPAVRLCLASGDDDVVGPESITLVSSASAPEPTRSLPEGAQGVAMSEEDLTRSYGLFDGFRRPETEGDSSLSTFLRDVLDSFGKAVDDATSLNVRTYTSHDIPSAAAGEMENNAKLRAYTRISLDGDVDAAVPRTDDGKVDQALWAIHMDMVKQAQDNRTEMVKTALDVVSDLVDALGMK